MTTITAEAAHAQNISCRARERPSVGFAIGRSAPYFYLESEAVDPDPSGSISVRSGWQISGRGDISIGGPWRVRVEGSGASWQVEQTTYSPTNGQVLATSSEGRVSVGQIGAAVGVRGGREPVCWYVLAGGGLYSLAFRDDTVRRPGFSLTPGIEIPTGQRGRVQVELQLHIIDTQSRYPISSSTALATAIVAGWAYRF